jgi:uncharacterized delta-60 repeat protein
MRPILVLLPLAVVLGCGGHDPGATVDGGGPGGGDGATAGFCDGAPHAIGNGLVRAMAVDAQGRLLVLGTQVVPRETLYLRRFLPDGTLDPSFGEAGVITTPEATDAEAFALLPDGGILVGGGLITGSGVDSVQSPLLLGYDDQGQPTGFRYTEAPTRSSRYVQAIMLQGTSYAVEIDYLLHRMDATGTLDPTFGDAGDAGVGLSRVVQTDDGFFIADVRLQQLSIYRLDADGQQVQGSVAMLDTDAFMLEAALSRANDATLIGQMMASPPNNFDLIVGRILADGTPDTASYGPDGFVVLDAGPNDAATSAYELPDGGLLLGVEGGTAKVLHVAPDGSLAHAYDFYPGTVAAVTLWNGMIVIAGNTEQSGVIACTPP